MEEEDAAPDGEVATEEVSRNERRIILRDHRREVASAAREAKQSKAKAHSIAQRWPAQGDASDTALERDAGGLAPVPPPELHGSHELWWCGGFFFCGRCGGIRAGAGGRLGLLPRECRAEVPVGSKDRWKKLRQGILPSGYAEWPDGATANLRRTARRCRAGSE